MTLSETYQPLLKSSSKRPKSQMRSMPVLRDIADVLSWSISVPVWLSLGALLQAVVLLLPLSSLIQHWRVYAILPPVLFLLSRLISSLLVQFNITRNPYLDGALFNRYSAIIPDRAGNFPSTDEAPNKNKVAVLVLSAKINHPLGYFGSPHSNTFREMSEGMFKQLDELPQSETGFLGQSGFNQATPSGAVENMSISYWRSLEDIHAYAASPLHTEAIQWWNKASKSGGLKHIGIMHEAFEAPAGMWESVYINFQPTMLGATTYLKSANEKDASLSGTVSEEWLSPIVDASRGKLRSSKGRLGWDARREGRYLQVQEEKTGQLEDEMPWL